MLRLFRRSYPFRDLEVGELEEAIRQLDELRLLRKFGDSYSPRNPKALQYYFENLSVIPDVQKYTVFDFFRKRRIGTLDQDFVARRCVAGVEFILHGQTWRVISVDEEKFHLEVEAAPPKLRSEEHTSELQSLTNLVCRLLLEKKKKDKNRNSKLNTSSNVS